MTIERPAEPLAGPGAVLRDFGGIYAINAFVGFLFAATGPVAIILTVGARGGLSEADLASWIFGSFFLNGLITIAFCAIYRQPLVFFWSIPGTVLIGPALEHLSFAEVIGAYYVCGLLMLLLGLTGLVRRCMDTVPMPIVMGMVAGVFLQFGLDLVLAFRDGLWIALPMTLVFLGLTAQVRIGRVVPPLIGALLAGAAAIAATGGSGVLPETPAVLAEPVLYRPALSWQAMVELVIPLTIAVLVVQNGQGTAVLSAAGHKAPVNAIAAACGAGSIVSASVGSVSTCLTGPVNAIISGSGEKHRQYTAGIAVGVFAILFGLLAPLFTQMMLAAPAAFVATLAGLAMLRVLQSAFSIAFRGRFSLGALVTFLVTVADVSIFNIGAPFWGLVVGFAVSWILERHAD